MEAHEATRVETTSQEQGLADLVDRARTGDAEAFSAAAGASLGRLFGLAALMLRDQHLAEDAVQEALISAWRGIRALRDPQAWDAWLQRAVVRACYRQTRSVRRIDALWTSLATREEPAIADESFSISSRDEIERGFDGLSMNHRAVIALHFYADLSLEEVADVLGVPVGTAKSRLHRALQAMRATLDADRRAADAQERSI